MRDGRSSLLDVRRPNLRSSGAAPEIRPSTECAYQSCRRALRFTAGIQRAASLVNELTEPSTQGDVPLRDGKVVRLLDRCLARIGNQLGQYRLEPLVLTEAADQKPQLAFRITNRRIHFSSMLQ